MKSWRTTTLGILTALIALSSAVVAEIDDKPETRADWPLVLAAISSALSGVGLMAARDNKVTSEQVGAK